MCKVLMIAGIKRQHQEKIKKILDVAAKAMSKSEDDGVGYAGITSQGKVYGEKWLNKDDAFKIHTQPKITASQTYLEKLLGDAANWKDKKPSNDIVYHRFGNMHKNILNDTVGLILHARKKTSGDKVISNVHPFFIVDDKKQEDIALIHNGTIHNHMALTKQFSTCDSEVILHEYINQSLNYNPWGIEEVAKTLRGDYTVGVLSSRLLENNKIVPYLDIFKHNKDLHVGYCPDIETAIFSTWPMTLEEVARETGFKIENIVEISDGQLIRLNAVTGQREDDLIKFTGQGREVYPYGRTGWDSKSSSSQPSDEGNVVEIKTKATDDDIEETIEHVKNNFETAHSELFNQKYQDFSEGLTKAEKEFMISLKNADNTNLKALKLVEKVLGLSQTS